MRKVNLVIKPGNNPACIHHENIVGVIGTCSKCGQVRDYSHAFLIYESVNNLKRIKGGRK